MNFLEQHRIEEWALRIVENVNRGHPSEDSRVELKAEWPDPAKAARRIAGHANASRGAPILWLIGVDERRGVVGTTAEELSTWFSSMRAQFEGLAPVLVDLNIPVGESTVVALMFETDRAPFIVKNPAYNTPGGGPVELEIPWREATSVRSARRSDLIRMLSPLQSLPEVEVLGAELATQRQSDGMQWHLEIDFYIAFSLGEQLIVPHHAYDVWIEEYARLIGSPELPRIAFKHKAMSSPDNTARQAAETRNPLVLANAITGWGSGYIEDLRLVGPSRVTLGAIANSALLDAMTVSKVLARVNLKPVGAGTTVPVEVILTKSWGDNHGHQWLYRGRDGLP